MHLKSRWIRLPLKILLWVVVSIIALVVILVIALQIPAVQNMAASKGVAWLQKKIGTTVQLNKISIGFPKTINITGFYLEDKQGDTLLYVSELNVGVDMVGLLSNRLFMRSVVLQGVTGSVKRLYPDTTFNYSFIIDAFATPDSVNPADTSDNASKDFEIIFKSIKLTDIRLTFSDTLSGLDAYTYIGNFETAFDDFDLQKMVFETDEIKLHNTVVSYLQTPPLTASTSDTGSSVMPNIKIRNINLENIAARFASPASGLNVDASLQKLRVKIDSLDLGIQHFAIDRLQLDGAKIALEQSKPQQFDTLVKKVVKEEGIEKVIETPQWKFTMNELKLRNNDFKYNNLDSIPKSKGLDFNHLDVKNFHLATSDMYIAPGEVKLKIDSLFFAEKSGFTLNQMATSISYDTTNITLANLEIRTPDTYIGNHLEANFKSITKIADNIDKVNVHIVLDSTHIAMTDVLYFMPELQKTVPQVKIADNEILSLNGVIEGSLEEINIDKFTLTNNKSTSLFITAVVREALNTERLYASVDKLSFTSSRSDIQSYLAADMLPSSVSIPDAINLDARFKGYIKNFDAVADLKTTYGNLHAKVDMEQGAKPEDIAYDGEINVDAFDLGQLLMQPDTLGPVTLSVKAKGQGTDPDNLHAVVDVRVAEAYYNKYVYKDIVLNGNIVNKSFDGTLKMQDENLDFSFDGLINTDPDSLALVFDMHLNKADLKALNLSADTFNIQAAISSDLAKHGGPNPVGNLKVYDLLINKAGLNCPVDSILLTSVYEGDSSRITVNSSFLQAGISGDFILTEIMPVLMSNMQRYFSMPLNDTSATAMNAKKKLSDTLSTQHDLRFKLKVQDPNTICDNLVPGLKSFTPLEVNGSYNSSESAIVLNADIPRIEYNTITVDSLIFKVTSDAVKLDYNFYVGEISTDALALEMFNLEGSVSDNRIAYKINAQKTDTFNVLRTSGVFAVENNDYTLIIDEPLVLNNTAWKIDPDNMITFSDKGLDAQKVVLSGSGQMISILTQPGDYAPLKITFENFSLANFSQIIEKDTDLARGRLDGFFTLLNVDGVSAFTSDLSIDSLHFMENPVGNISLRANNSEDPKRFNIDFALGGYDNDVKAGGVFIATDNAGVLDLNIDLQRLNMETVQPFTFGQVNRMSGYLSGAFKISGTTDKPDPRGSLSFHDVAFNAPMVNTYLKVSNNTIDVNNHRLIINNFSLTDSLNNVAKLNGFADFSDFANLNFDMRLKTEDFLALNSTRHQEDMPVYGKVILDSDIHITGSPSSPVIDMRVLLNNGSEFVFVMPESQASLNESEGIVIFTDSLASNPVAKNDTIMNTVSNVQGVALNASITFEPQAVLKMLVDPVAGDSLFVSGDGTLNFKLDPGGQMNLTGRYNINKGGYNITLNQFLKRQFTIKEGSSITWTGDIMEALVDLTAIYQVRTSPLLLLEDQIDATDEASRNRYRNALTFLVFLNIDGALTSPQIGFDIDQPDAEKGAMGGAVNAKLNELRTDPSQLNKQVFALLALNRFLGQDPFETGNAPMTVESATRASASKLLTQQFSALSDKYIKGVDLDVGVNSFEDYSSGTEEGRTQLQLGVSKEFLNDRVTVQVGGNVELEGDRARQNNASDLAGNVNVEYKLRPDGRYLLRGFRRIEYENPIEGELIDTGIGFSYSREFIRFRQLFMSDKKLRELRQKRQQMRETNEKSENGQNK